MDMGMDMDEVDFPHLRNLKNKESKSKAKILLRRRACGVGSLGLCRVVEVRNAAHATAQA